MGARPGECGSPVGARPFPESFRPPPSYPSSMAELASLTCANCAGSILEPLR